jgi:hypothetical protein
VIAPWPRGDFLLPRVVALLTEVQIALYGGDGRAAAALAARALPSLLRGRLEVPLLAGQLRYFRGLAALALSREVRAAAPLLRALAARDARALTRPDLAWARPLAASLKGAIAADRGALTEAARHLEAAARDLEASGLFLYAAAARRRLGQLVGGDRGASLVAEADAWMAARGVRCPPRITAMLAGGEG